MKLNDDVLNRRVDIGMVKLEVVQNSILWVVVDKLWSLVKKSTVVLVSFNDKVFAGTTPCGGGKGAWDCTNKEAGSMPACF